MTRKPNNRKAPRCFPRKLSLFSRGGVADLHAEVKEAKDLSANEVKLIVNSFNQALADTVAQFRDGVELPEGLGTMFVGSCNPPKFSNFDYPKTEEYKQDVTYQNLNSDSYLAKIFYMTSENKYNFKDCEIWGFKAARSFTQKVSEVYTTDWKKYVRIDPSSHIAHLFRRNNNRISREREEQLFIKEYNELALD